MMKSLDGLERRRTGADEGGAVEMVQPGVISAGREREWNHLKKSPGLE